MRFKFHFIFLVTCLCVTACGEERLPQTLMEVMDQAELEEPPISTVGPVPPEIANLLWGDEDTLLRNAQQKHYTKYINAGGIAIMGDHSVSDRFFQAGREIILAMTSKRPELREVLSVKTKFRMILVLPDAGLASIPEVDIDYVLNHTKGIAFCGSGIASSRSYFCVQTVQEHPLPDKDDLIMNTFVHEFGHAIYRAINNDIDPTFQERLEEAYTNALETGGVWGHGTYGLENVHEYWAVGVTDWFYDVAQVETPEWQARFLEKDPRLYALLDEWFPLTHLQLIESKW